MLRGAIRNLLYILYRIQKNDPGQEDLFVLREKLGLRIIYQQAILISSALLQSYRIGRHLQTLQPGALPRGELLRIAALPRPAVRITVATR